MRTRWLRACAVVLAVSLSATACSDGDDGADTPKQTYGDGGSSCAGEPIQLTTIIARTGPLAFGNLAEEAGVGLEAALAAVNDECALGRPLAVDVCDEKSDPNESTACGREAVENGSLAFIGRNGLFTNGVEAAQLPALYAVGSSSFELSNELALSSGSVVAQLLACATFPAAAGYEEVLFVSADTPEGQGSMATITALVDDLGGTAGSLFYPPDTTDFAPVAAQVQERDPDAICLIANEMVPLVNALADVGITPDELPIVSGAALVPPHVVEELGEAAEGMFLISQVVDPADEDNAGVQQMREEMEAVGIDLESTKLSTESVYYWSIVHTLVDAIRELPAEQIETLDSASLQTAVAAHSPVDRPEVAPFDFSKPAFADLPILAPLRVFTRTAMVVRVEDGEYKKLSDFVDVASPTVLDFG